jgi:hypothetical protein
MTLPVYITGTVSVSNLGTVVTGTGCMWSGINAREGDFFTRPDGVAIITEVTDATHLKITPWPGATIAGGTYAIEQNYVGRVVGVAAAEDVGVMLEKLHVDGLPFIVGADETVPDPSYGDEGQMAFKPDTGAWWVKSGGVWVPSYGLTALGYGGTSATSILIATGPATFTTQSGLAYNGARVRAASAANLNNWMEGVATYTGTSLAMTADKIHGSGTHADWLLSIGGQPGLDGTGTGDMQAANNLSELTATAPTARKNVYAAPFDALAYNGMQINGSMEVSQELGTSGKSGIGWICDGWRQTMSGTMVQFGATVAFEMVPGFPQTLFSTTTTAQPSLGAGDYAYVFQVIEGYRVSRLGWGTAGAQPITLGFWTAHARAGTYSVVVKNEASTRAYATTYTQSVAGVMQYNTVTIPGCTDGTWIKTDTAGMAVLFTVAAAAGGTYTAPTNNSWLTSNYISALGQINGVAATSDVFRITGVVVLPGIEAPSAARSPLIMRPYDQELLTCRRYYAKYAANFIVGFNVTAGETIFSSYSFQTPMRSSPALTFPGALSNNTSTITLGIATDGFRVDVVTPITGGFYLHYPTIIADARL